MPRTKTLFVYLMMLVIMGVFAGSFAFAHDPSATGTDAFWRPGQPIVPCGMPGAPECDTCQLLHLVRHIIDLIMIVAAPILATVFFLYAGVMMMMGGANPGMLAQGKRIFKDTMIGLLIVMMAWLITNTVIGTIATPSTIRDQDGNLIFQSDKWYQFSCPANQ